MWSGTGGKTAEAEGTHLYLIIAAWRDWEREWGTVHHVKWRTTPNSLEHRAEGAVEGLANTAAPQAAVTHLLLTVCTPSHAHHRLPAAMAQVRWPLPPPPSPSL